VVTTTLFRRSSPASSDFDFDFALDVADLFDR
jgi:hypothetical protein